VEMTHAHSDEPILHMGVPINHGKLAMWVFLATEIMFFTGLIGTYIVLRHGSPTAELPWPTPKDVHLIEWVGALNTFVLICSSLTVVLAHWEIGRGQIKKAVLYVAATLSLGGVFLIIKGFEYTSKYQHRILPGLVFDNLEGPAGPAYLDQVREELNDVVQHSKHEKAVSRCRQLLEDLEPRVTLADNSTRLTKDVREGDKEKIIKYEDLSPKTVGKAAAAGANVIVAGTSVFRAADAADAIRQLRSDQDA